VGEGVDRLPVVLYKRTGFTMELVNDIYDSVRQGKPFLEIENQLQGVQAAHGAVF
jgi:hypothetical protein